MALLELAGVTRSVVLPDGSDLHILRGIDLAVEAGEQVSIVGRSGTGKSTLLNIMGLLDRPTSGTYTVAGVDVLRLHEARRARMRGSGFGFVFQQFNIFNARTAQENVEVPLLYATGSDFWRRGALAAAMLERVGLGDRLDSYPTQMSGGEQQRIAIARALVRKPRIILADEPTGALDPDTGRAVMALLEEVAHENDSALVVITHDLNVAVRADRVLALGEGVLQEVTDAREALVPTVGGERVAALPGDGLVGASVGTAVLSRSVGAVGAPAPTGSPADPAHPAEDVPSDPADLRPGSPPAGESRTEEES